LVTVTAGTSTWFVMAGVLTVIGGAGRSATAFSASL
jgi:hypothetical protein